MSWRGAARSGRSSSSCCPKVTACGCSRIYGDEAWREALTGLARRSAEREIQELLEFRCVRRLRTVHGLLQEANGLGLLADPFMEKATAEIVAGSRPRFDIQRDIKQKERAREMLVRKYKSSSLPEVHTLAALHGSCCHMHASWRGILRVLQSFVSQLTTYHFHADGWETCIRCPALHLPSIVCS